MKNIRNKILSKEEIIIEGDKRMKELLSKYPKREHSTLMRFLNEATEINLWLSNKRERFENSKNKASKCSKTKSEKKLWKH